MSRGRIFLTGLCLLALPMLMAAKPSSSRIFKGAEQVEMFSAIEAGDIEVKLIPKDATQSTILFKNLTKKPLRIEVPAAFAGVPVLAQADDFGDDFGGGGFRGGPGGGFGGGPGSFGNFRRFVSAFRLVGPGLQTRDHGDHQPHRFLALQIQ